MSPLRLSPLFTSDEPSGIRPIPAGLDEARRAWEQEDRIEEAAELAMFEWHLFLTELDPAPVASVASVALVALVAPALADADAAGQRVAPPAEIEEAPALSAPPASRAPRASARRGAWVVIAVLYAGLVAVAATRPGSDALASWLTMGHAGAVRQAVQGLGAPGR
jgi:hypothetical protein